MEATCPLCIRLKQADDYAYHYATFYVHVLAEQEGREKSAAILAKLAEAGVGSAFPDAFCITYRATFQREYGVMQKEFWDFFTSWDYHTCSEDDRAAACGYRYDGLRYHVEFNSEAELLALREHIAGHSVTLNYPPPPPIPAVIKKRALPAAPVWEPDLAKGWN